MSTVTTRSAPLARTLHLAFDLGNRVWTLAFATSIAHAPRLRLLIGGVAHRPNDGVGAHDFLLSEEPAFVVWVPPDVELPGTRATGVAVLIRRDCR